MTDNIFDNFRFSLVNQAITESMVGEDKLPKLSKLVVSYLKRKTSKDIIGMPFLDQWQSKNGRGWGYRIVWGQKGESIRFNWEHLGKVSPSASLTSIDYWTGMETNQNPMPSRTVVLDKNMSMVKVLPMVVEIINNPAILDNSTIVIPITKLTENVDEDLIAIGDLSAYTLTEAESVGISSGFDKFVNEMAEFIDRLGKSGKKAKKGDFYSRGKSVGNKLFEMLAEYADNHITKEGVSLVFDGTGGDLYSVIATNHQAFASAFGGGTIKRGGSGSERIAADSGLAAMIEEAERVSFEQQLSDLEDLVALVVSGATNALFAAGRGGVGKCRHSSSPLNIIYH